MRSGGGGGELRPCTFSQAFRKDLNHCLTESIVGDV